MAGVGSTVEADATSIGRKDRTIKRRGHGHKNAVLSPIDVVAVRFVLSMSRDRAQAI
jgi:hypothetical protein